MSDARINFIVRVCAVTKHGVPAYTLTTEMIEAEILAGGGVFRVKGKRTGLRREERDPRMAVRAGVGCRRRQQWG